MSGTHLNHVPYRHSFIVSSFEDSIISHSGDKSSSIHSLTFPFLTIPAPCHQLDRRLLFSINQSKPPSHQYTIPSLLILQIFFTLTALFPQTIPSSATVWLSHLISSPQSSTNMETTHHMICYISYIGNHHHT